MSAPSLFAVVAVGCIECGVPTDFVGVFETLEDAKAAKAAYLSEGDSWARYGGDGFVAIYAAPSWDEVEDEDESEGDQA